MSLDYNSILKECGLGSESATVVARNITNLEEFYDTSDLINIYNFCLKNVSEPEIIMHVIKLADSYKNNSTLEILSDILLMKCNNTFDDSDILINIRVLCAKAISNYKNTDSVETFLFCMNNKNEHYKVRLACADALGRIGDKYAVQPLIDVISDENEKSVYLKESATFALGMLGDVSAIDPLVSILESKHGLFDKFSFLKEKIVEALGRLNSNNGKILKALKHSLMDSSPIVRINAIEAIMNSGDKDAAIMIKPCLEDEDDEVKKNAIIALYNLLGRDVLDKIIELPIYSEYLKTEAQNLIDEYESDDDEVEEDYE